MMPFLNNLFTGCLGDIFAFQMNTAYPWTHKTRDRVQGGAFACSIRADQGDDFALV